MLAKTHLILFLLLLGNILVFGCLITNCPRGGKRNGNFKMLEPNVKQCISCGPGQMGQCFGPNICCGPFGCLMGTPETLRCRREGFFQDREPCIAGISFCRKNTGRCASEGVCCNQDSCFSDRNCNFEDKKIPENIMGMELYNIMNYQNELSVEK